MSSYQVEALNLEKYQIDPQRGFLPSQDPLVAFSEDSSPYLRMLERIGLELPELLTGHKLRATLDGLETPDLRIFDSLSHRELTHACAIYSFSASAYAHQLNESPVDEIPRGVAVPLVYLSRKLGRGNPILSYDMYCLNNWHRIDPDGPILVDNLYTIQKFVRIPDEPWFILIHTEIEAKASPAIQSIGYSQQAVLEDRPADVQTSLEIMATSLDDMTHTLRRMPEGNSPDRYAVTFRPYIQKFSGIVYGGVVEFGGKPQTFRGETGAQSSIIPSLDKALGIHHAKTGLTDYVVDMRKYMPVGHRAFIEAVETGPSIREYVMGKNKPELTRAYNMVLDRLVEFRQLHLEFAISYIFNKVGDTVGTGGIPFRPWLNQLCNETTQAKL